MATPQTAESKLASTKITDWEPLFATFETNKYDAVWWQTKEKGETVVKQRMPSLGESPRQDIRKFKQIIKQFQFGQ